MASSPMVSGLIGGVVAVVLLTYVSTRAAKRGDNGELRYGRFLKGFGWVLAIAVAGLVFVMCFTDHRGQYVPLALLIAGFGLGAAYMLVEAYRTRGVFDAEGIQFETAWTGRKVQRWSNLVGIEFNSQMNWYVLEFRDGSRIRLSNLIHGHGRVLEHLRALGHEVR